jgi:hypothetical protein
MNLLRDEEGWLTTTMTLSSVPVHVHAWLKGRRNVDGRRVNQVVIDLVNEAIAKEQRGKK